MWGTRHQRCQPCFGPDNLTTVKQRKLPYAAGPLSAVVRVPGSKSLTNRALVAAALARGTSVLSNALFADDTGCMMEALRQMGFSIATDVRGGRIEITGFGGQIPAIDADCHCGNSGTTIRFCAALAALGRGEYTFDGVARMRERPIGPLCDALAALGAGIEYTGVDGCPPVTIRSRGLTGGTVQFNRPVSSQFISALLLAAPAAQDDVLIEINGPLVSRPYVAMTTAVMDAFNVAVIADERGGAYRFIVPAPQHYAARHYAIEPDASNASYFLAAAAMAGGSVTVEGFNANSLQGDVGFVHVLERMGCRVSRHDDRITVQGPPRDMPLKALEIDLNDMPDMVQTVAVLALRADGPTTIENVANLRIKETDRIEGVATELRKLGAQVEEAIDGLTIHPPERLTPCLIDTYGDHRMAMCFALAGLVCHGVTINGADCVSKTFPDFFEHWEAMVGGLR